MLHYLRIAVTALSLMACVLLVALWVRSYWRCYLVEGSNAQASLIAGSGRGYLTLGWKDLENPLVVSNFNWEFDSYPPDHGGFPSPKFLGFYYQRTNLGTVLYVPYLVPVVFTGALPAIFKIHKRFSLRTLLIATTLVAMVLGIVVAWS